MPRHCCVPECKANYDSTRVSGSKSVTVFSFPKDPVLRRKWFNAVPRKNWELTNNSVICIHHFRAEDLYKPYGNRIKPVKDAVPSIFPMISINLHPPEISKRVNPEVRRENVTIRLEQQIEEAFKLDTINNFGDIFDKLEKKLNLLAWNVLKMESKVVFYILEEDEETGCEFSVRVIVNRDLIVKVFLRDVQVKATDLSWVLPKNCKLSLWSQLENLLSRYKFERSSSTYTREDNIVKAISYLEQANNFRNDSEFSGKLEFIVDQARLLLLSQPRYNTCTIIASFLVYSLSSCAYDQLRKFLSLPCKRHLQYISSSLHVTPNFKETSNDERYIRCMTETLSEREKYVALLIDEIYIQKGFQYKSSNVLDLAENKEMQLQEL